jgi:hypothetical protein
MVMGMPESKTMAKASGSCQALNSATAEAFPTRQGDLTHAVGTVKSVGGPELVDQRPLCAATHGHCSGPAQIQHVQGVPDHLVNVCIAGHAGNGLQVDLFAPRKHEEGQCIVDARVDIGNDGHAFVGLRSCH